MIKLNQFLEMIDYHVDHGMPVMNKEPYGDSARELECHTPFDVKSGANEPIATVVFDTKTQVVYEANVADDDKEVTYRLLNPKYKERILDYEKDNVSWEGIKQVFLETDEDFLTKGRAIFLGEDYDPDISVPLDIDDETLLQAFIAAHENNMKFNDYVVEILNGEVENIKKEREQNDE